MSMVYYFYATYADPAAEDFTSTERITVDLALYPFCDPIQDNLSQAWNIAVNEAYKKQKRPGGMKRTLISIVRG